MTEIDPRDAHLYKLPPFHHLTVLIVLAVIGVAGAVVFAFWSGAVRAEYAPDVQLLGALGLLENASFMLAALATVGAIVLGGVRALHTTPELSQKSRR
ncbi:hypothetical protein [Microbacterium sp. USTB-Y]|uniref:hypothetical protein n=1 Tax=Microbacterium sp. USTB-Y TaxID=2823692 RepID=UPI00203A6951|nr:hypothetical protein [Microbacterium sp. USTB-Y]